MNISTSVWLTLAVAVVAAVVAADVLREDSGFVAATLMGVFLGNQGFIKTSRRVDVTLTLEFQETLVQLLIGVLFVLIGDVSKRVRYLGEKAPVPTEVLEFGFGATRRDLERLGCRPVLRERGGEPVRSDNGNLIVDCFFDAPFNPPEVAAAMNATPGVLEHGLFLGLAKVAYIADGERVLRLERE